MRYRAALFDFDGTLAPSLPLWVKAYQLSLLHYGISVSEEEVLRRCFFRDLNDVSADFGGFTAAEFQAQLDVGLQQAFTEAELFPLARPVVEHCRVHGLQTALVTSAPRALVLGVIERLKLSRLFDFIVCGDDVSHYKPHPESVLTTLAALERRPDEAIMIGDSHVDVLAGKAAGTRTALFWPQEHGRFHNAEKLHAAGADHIFRDHGELPALLDLPELAAFA